MGSWIQVDGCSLHGYDHPFFGLYRPGMAPSGNLIGPRWLKLLWVGRGIHNWLGLYILKDFSCFKGRSLQLVRFFCTIHLGHPLKRGHFMKEDQKPLKLFRWRETEVDLPPSGVPKFTLLEVSSWSLPLKSLIWLRPQYDWSCCCFVIFVPQKSSEVVIFQEVVLDLFGVSLLVFWSTVFTRKPIVSGKAIPLPHSEWGQPPTVEFHEVGLCVAPGLSCGRAGCWKPMAGSRTVCCHDQGVAFRGKGHPTLNRKSL